jgi:hypothetical protein
MIPPTPTSYTRRILASLPKRKIDRLTPHLTQVPVLWKKPGIAEDHSETFGRVACQSVVGINVGWLATVVAVEGPSSLRGVPV